MMACLTHFLSIIMMMLSVKFYQSESSSQTEFPNLCSGSDSDNVVPFPPSLLDLPDLRLLEYNGKQFKLACELLVCSITHPVT